MRARILFLAAVLQLSGISGTLLAPPVKPQDPETQLAAFYKRHFPVKEAKYIHAVCVYTTKYARVVGLEDEVPLLLSMAFRESGFNPLAVGNPKIEKSFGIYQTQQQYLKKLRAWWLSNNCDLPGDQTIEAQCAYGVSELFMKISDSHGDLLDAVRRFNGGGKGGKGLKTAQSYSHNVMKARKMIFEIKYAKGERHRQRSDKLKVWYCHL